MSDEEVQRGLRGAVGPGALVFGFQRDSEGLAIYQGDLGGGGAVIAEVVVAGADNEADPVELDGHERFRICELKDQPALGRPQARYEIVASDGGEGAVGAALDVVEAGVVDVGVARLAASEADVVEDWVHPAHLASIVIFAHLVQQGGIAGPEGGCEARAAETIG